MLPVGHTYVSPYATSDNETHFEWCKFNSTWWRNLRFLRSRSASAARFRVAEHLCSHSLNGVNQIFHGESGPDARPSNRHGPVNVTTMGLWSTRTAH
jgi:hypothetical protein